MPLVIAPGGYPSDTRYPGQNPEEGPPPLTGLAAAVSMQQLHALLAARTPDLLNRPDKASLVSTILRGKGAEVTAIVGAPTYGGTRWDLSIWAITLGAAASIEASLFPEQIGGESSRAELLQRQYTAVLSDLRRYVASSNLDPDGPGGAEPRDGFSSGVVSVGYGGYSGYGY